MKLTELRIAVLQRIVADDGRYRDSFGQALTALAKEGLVEPTTSNPTAEPKWIATAAGRAALSRAGK